jgi:small subunit ribosomal protein S8
MINDFVSDLLTRIRNSQRAGHKSVVVMDSRMNKQVLAVLKQEGMIDSYVPLEKPMGGGRALTVYLKYTSSGRPVISRADRVSKPGRRVYKRASELPKVSCGLGVAVISTSQGVLSDREARRKSVGGEVLALIG